MDAFQDRFIFELESSGSLKPENIVLYAIRVLNDKLQSVRNGIMEELDRTKEKDN